MKKIILSLFFIFTSNFIFAQYGNKDGNRIGITAGLTQMSLMTKNFTAKSQLGWIAGLSVRGNYYNDFSMIFGMQFTESNFSVETKTPASGKKEDVTYKMAGAQIRLLLSYNLVKDHVSLDFGPVLQVNGKLQINKISENNTISGTSLLAKDIIDVTKINGNLYVGISGGNRRVRAIVCYQYGLNNFLNNLNNKKELEPLNIDFKGNIGLVSGQLLFNL